MRIKGGLPFIVDTRRGRSKMAAMATVHVQQEGNIIHAIYSGAMTLEVVKDGERRIEQLIQSMHDPAILYDTLLMDPPTMRLALEMKAFDARVRTRVVRSATVVRDPATAFMAKVAFSLARDHKVFYDDLRGAYQWLEGSDRTITAEARQSSRPSQLR